METFVILPHQLFDIKYLDKHYNFIIWEHPHYFTDYKYNKKKIILHRGSMRYYFKYLKNNNYKVKYITFLKKPKINNYVLFDPIDKIQLPGIFYFVESPNFLLTKQMYMKYRKKTKNCSFRSFYTFGKKEINVIPMCKSQDKNNRKKIPSGMIIPKIPPNIEDIKFINDGIRYADKYFKKNYGNTKNFIFPLTHKTTKKWLKNFIKNKFSKFGDYQDSIMKGELFLFHSVLSALINIGLLNPLEIINEIMKIKNKIPINSFEGYIRQLFWREYMRMTYIHQDYNKNYFGNKKKLNDNWYNGTLNIEPVDDCIKKGFDSGYLHHIERLMIVGNYMNLSGIDPKEGYKWFMEFSCDSYDWVMATNVYEMVFFCSGGNITRKPYVSSSNYVLKMSNYKKGKWDKEWNDKYQKFITKHKKKLWKYRYHFSGIKNL